MSNDQASIQATLQTQLRELGTLTEGLQQAASDQEKEDQGAPGDLAHTAFQSAPWTSERVQDVAKATWSVLDPTKLANFWEDAYYDKFGTEEEKEKRKAERAAQRTLADDLAAAAAAEGVTYERLVFKEQCFLLAKIFDLVAYKKEQAATTTYKPFPYMGYGISGAEAMNASLQVEGDPFDFMNVMTQNGITAALFNMENSELANLQPQIRLYKVKEDDSGKEYQQEFKFDAYATEADVSSVFADKSKRGFGIGIKKFSFAYDGNNPFAAQKSIKAKLHIFANSFSELLVDRGGYKYADLALKTGKISSTQGLCDEDTPNDIALNEIRENLDALDFRLKAVVGWAYPSGNKDIFTSYSASGKNSILEAISESYVTLNLIPTIHEFKIDEQGRVNFIINYRAYIDTFFNQPYFNIFYDSTATLMQTRRELLYEALKEKCTSEQLSKIKQQDAESNAVAKEKAMSLQSLLVRMDDLSLIKYIPLSYDELKSFQTMGPYYEASGSIEIKNASDAMGTVSQDLVNQYLSVRVGESISKEEYEKKSAQIKVTLEAQYPGMNYVGFFYVSELVDTILASIEEYLKDYSESGAALDDIKAGATTDPDLKHIEDCQYEDEKIAITKFYKNFKRFRVILGPVEIINPKDNGEATYISLGDIPVSVKYFIEWLNEKMTNNKATTYFLSAFLIDFFNDLISNFLNDAACFSHNTKQKIVLNQSVFTSYPPPLPEGYGTALTDELTQHMLGTWVTSGAKMVPDRVDLDFAKGMEGSLLNISGPPGSPRVQGDITEEINYLAFSAGRTPGSRPRTGNKLEDEEDGIFHYMLGRRRGIVKNISLTKTNAKYLKEVRFEQDGFQGLEQLRDQYDITVNCLANVRTFPGTYIFVDPRGWAPETTLGAGDLMNITRYGIGGYCMIYLSEHSFGPGEANTTLYTKWVQETNPTTDPLGNIRANVGDGTATICTKILADREAAAAAAAAKDTVSMDGGDLAESRKNPTTRAIQDRLVGAPKEGIEPVYGFGWATVTAGTWGTVDPNWANKYKLGDVDPKPKDSPK
ncbi:hypothetical protein CMI47_15605 [Candidatus Pacearchaeota archaeon]|nr:hypothetical protein [Candidatus Pacearchaeota archaeon]